MTDRRILFSGEMQLCRWSESSTNGATVTMWVHPDDLDSFKALRARSGKHAGQRLACVLVELGDDEAVVEQPEATPAPTVAPGATPSPRRYHPPHIGPLGMLAVRYCKDKQFQRWAADQWGDVNPLSEADAKDFILKACGLVAKHGQQASRKHLDIDPEAAALFHENVRLPYLDYLRDQGAV